MFKCRKIGHLLASAPARRVGVLPLLVLMLWCGGCAHGSRISNTARGSIYERSTVQFDRTVLFKPAESERPEYQLAPLLLEQVLAPAGLPQPPQAVYYWRTFAQCQGRVLEQFNYVWFQRGTRPADKIPQGVRITLDPGGKPVVWEVLRDPTGTRVLFVSQSLEAMAMTNGPAVMPGRRFWVERPVDEAPDVVVARILDDAPAVMGPTVYLESGSQAVSTLICRCMEAQAREVEATGIYRLARLDETVMRWLIKDKNPGMARWLPGEPADDLARWLHVGPH